MAQRVQRVQRAQRTQIIKEYIFFYSSKKVRCARCTRCTRCATSDFGRVFLRAVPQVAQRRVPSVVPPQLINNQLIKQLIN